MKKFLVLALSLLLVVTMVAGCTKEVSKGEGKKIAMVTDVGGVNDQSFNQSAWEGLEKVEKDFGVKVSYKESKQEADYPTNFETVLDANNDIIWGIGFKMADSILDAAKTNPEQNYAIIDAAYEGEMPKNLLAVVFKAQEPSFLVGYIAGKMTETNKIGFVGGMDLPVINQFQYGFRAGVKLANPDAEVIEQFAESFVDAAKGKAIANQMYQKGADIVFHAAGGVGDGVIEAAKEKNKYAIGVDRDQNYLAPDNVITSAMKLVGNAIYNVAEDFVDGTFEGGTTIVYGLKEGGVGIAPTSNKHVPENILKEVEKLEKDIINGDIVVPFDKTTWEEYNK